MSRVTIRHSHALSPRAARERLTRIAERLAETYDADWEWRGDEITIEHSSVTGRVRLSGNEVVIDAKLGFLLSMFRDQVETEVARLLDVELRPARDV
jgi:putative polyhydroxyalkanoate system protein